MSKQTFIIVGASLTGAKAAEELRERGFDGRVVLIGNEPDRPYERPPLTKDYLRGESERDKAYVHEADFYAQHEIELLTDTAATALDPGTSRITLHDGRGPVLGDRRSVELDHGEWNPESVRRRRGDRRFVVRGERPRIDR